MTTQRIVVTALLAGLGAVGGAAAAVVMNFASSLVSGEGGVPGYVLYQFDVLAASAPAGESERFLSLGRDRVERSQ